jgi:hypothetical protein
LCQGDHFLVGSRPADETFARGFAKCQTKFDAGYGRYQGFMDIFNGFYEMRLPKDEVDRDWFFNFYSSNFHAGHLLSARPNYFLMRCVSTSAFNFE